MDILSEIKKLNFDSSEYVIIGGASMALRGLKETKDIDILISQSLLEKLKRESAWRHHPRIIPTDEAGLVNDDGTIELYPTIGSDIDLSFDLVKHNQEIVDGIPCISLNDLLLIKQTYKREKDFNDIKLIEAYLASM